MDQLLRQHRKVGGTSGPENKPKSKKRGRDGRQQNDGGDGAALGLKSLALADGVANKSKTYAVLCETLKFKQSIDQVLGKAKVKKTELARSEGKSCFCCWSDILKLPDLLHRCIAIR